jgi:hypothetical protein
VSKVLDKASAAIASRHKIYGDSSAHHKITAQLWGAYLARDVTSTEVAIMMLLDKVARQRNDPSFEDNYIDMAGYADRAAHNAKAGEDQELASEKRSIPPRANVAVTSSM